MNKELINPEPLVRLYRDEIRRIVLEHKGLNPRVVKPSNNDGEIDIVIDAGENQSLMDVAQIGFALDALFGHEVVGVLTTAQLSEFFHARGCWADEVIRLLSNTYPL